MADQERQPSHAEQRMLAVAKLKRAASLPRMKDGRRPPMHVEAVSEGEKGASDVEKAASGSEKAVSEEDKNQTDEEKKVAADSPQPEESHIESAEADAEDAEGDVEERTVSPRPTSRNKRRTRSRSRSRGSKDMKGKNRAMQSPIPPVIIAGDSSQDEAPPPPRIIALPVIPPLLSPIPSSFAVMSNSRLLRSPTPLSPEPSLFYPGTSPPTPIPLPTLEALQRGLMRSNSAGSTAAGRRMAMHKLTGGTETYDPSPSPTPPPQIGKLGRNNTVSGGERTAARQNMLSRLGGRITKEADAEQASGAEEVHAPSLNPKRKRRRSRRSSTTAPPVVSDSDFISTSPSTPIVPPTPLPHLLETLRARSATPNQAFSNLEQSIEVSEELPPVPKQDEVEVERPEVTRRRSVVVEEEEDEEDNDYLAQPRHPGPPVTPPQIFPSQSTALRAPHSSDAPSNASSDSTTATGVGVPIFLSQRPMSRNDIFPSSFPSSPFTTPLKEKTISDDDEVLYPADSFRPRTPYATFGDEYEREISWVASPVPEIRMPIDEVDDDEDNLNSQQDDLDDERDYDDAPLSATSSRNFSPLEDVSPRASSDSKSLFIESETSPNLPPSPSSVAALSQSLSIIPVSDDSTSPQVYPARLSIASRIQSERSPVNAEFTEWEDRIPSESLKRNGEASSPSTWEKVKNTFARAGPSSGRRSRSNSIVTRERRDYTDSSISRESGASLTSARTDRGDSVGTFTQQQQQQAHQPLMQSPSASASILSLPTHAPPRGSASPIPPPSSSDLLKYQDAKLFPFPGMKKLEEQRRAKGFPAAASSSTPDVTMLTNGSDETQSHFSTALETPDATRERKLSHQASDTRLLAKYIVEQSMSATASTAYQDNIDNGSMPAPLSSGAGTLNLKLPMTLPGVKQWLSKNNKKKNVIPQSPSSAISIIHPVIDAQQAPNNKKPSLSDLLRRKDSELGTDWEDIGGTTPTSASGDTLLDRNQNSSESSEQWRLISSGLDVGRSEQADSQKTPRSKQANSGSHTVAVESFHLSFDDSPSNEPRSDPLLSATPDPSSSLSDYPAHSTSESSSTSSSQYSLGILGTKGSLVLERLEESLARGSRSPIWTAAIDDPPRKLILSSPVLQVVNPHTVKDRFLFLFNDILIIAKPVIQDQDLLDTYKPMPLDRKYVVKSVVHVRDLHLGPDRTEPQAKTANHGTASRNPLVKAFINLFAKDPDHAITNFFSKSNTSEDPVLLGQLLFKSLELDRARLGEYLSQRASKSVLKTYLDCFGFAGLRVDKALRAFLFSISVPRVPGALEYLLDSFASRWYEANARIVAYDKDMAIRLVRALIQLNEFLHDGITHEFGSNGFAKRSVESKVFVDAFRRYDVRYLVSDELLEELYESILHERLCQARRMSSGPTEVLITIKRPLPPRLTYKVQSDPIILRIPQADPQLSIQLYGQDLVFEPPILNFGKSSEASFRVMGTSLGVKTMIMCRSGPNALKYSGLPLSTTLNVERAFMRNTFQLAFLNHAGMKRRYMFSVDDSLLRHQWAVFLKRHIDNSAASSAPGSPGASKFYKSAEKVAFKVLQETLIGSAVQSSLHRPSLSAQNGLSNSFFADRSGFSRPTQTTSMHIRSKSRSRVYHRGAGRNELDLSQDKAGSDEGEDNDVNDDSIFYKPEHGPRVDGLIWSGRDLEVQCLQNSSIPLVLSFLQIGAPELGQTLTS